MRSLDRFRLWCRSLLRRNDVEAKLDAELRFHLDRQIEENLAAGMPPDEARYAALRRIGGVAQIEEECRDARSTRMIESILADLRLALRTLRRDLTFSVVSTLTLTLGIGLTTAIFTIVDRVVLRPLPFLDPDRLVTLWETDPHYPAGVRFSPGNFLDLRAQSRAFQQIGGLAQDNYNLTGAGDPEQIAGGLVSGNLFAMLGVHPELGRLFVASDDSFTAERTVILTHRLWMERFGGDPGVIGKTLRLDDRAHTIIGVMPAGFEILNADVDLWLPIERKIDPEQMHWRYSYYVAVIARMKPGISLEQARQDVDRVVHNIRRDYPKDTGTGGAAAPLLDRVAAPVRGPLLILLGAAAFVLLIACANVANLSLAHTTARSREVAVRMALGASRGRIIRQLFTESFALAAIGGSGGAALAIWGVKLLLTLAPQEIPRSAEIQVDPRVLFFTLLATCDAAIVFGLMPALAGSGMEAGLKESSRTSPGGPRARRARNLLVIGEVALALVLVIGAALMLESFHRVRAVDPGFDPHGVVSMRIPLGETKYPGIAKQAGFYDTLIERVRAIPGAGSATLIDGLPFAAGGFDNSFTIEGRPDPPPGEYWKADIRRIDPRYFETMRIPLLEGRPFTDSERMNSPDVAIVSQSLARHYWPGESPLGKRLDVHFGNPRLRPQIVGVAADVHNALDGSPPELIYVPYRQGRHVTNMYLIIRGDPGLVNAVRAAIASIDPDQPVHTPRAFDEYLTLSLATRRFETSLLSGFAALASVLAAIGLYGLLAFTVQTRTREIGVRTALGADARQVFGLVVRDAMKLAAIGIAAGLAGAFALTRVLEQFLFGIRASDQATFAGSVAGVFLVALAASLIPARRAASVDPMKALRHE
jgi:putative ABC transport system permease protein